MKSPYQSPALISAAMDDAGLTPHEFRILAHVCRRAGDGSNGRGCDASVASMAEVCGFDVKTVRGALQRLTAAGWLEAIERPGKPTGYLPRIPGDSPDPYHSTVAHPYQPEAGDPYRSVVAKGNPIREPIKGKKTDTATPAESCGTGPQSFAGDRGGSASDSPGRGSGGIVAEDDARRWGRKIHEEEGKSSDSVLAMFPPAEAERWAVDWFVAMERQGWELGGSPVVNPRAALRGYLRKAAEGRSRGSRIAAGTKEAQGHLPSHHLGYRPFSRVNAADLPPASPDEINDDDIPF